MPGRSRLTLPDAGDRSARGSSSRPAEAEPATAELLALQRSAGNQAVLRLIDTAQLKPTIKKANRWFSRDKSSLGPLLDAVDAYNASDISTMANQLADLKVVAREAAAAHRNPNKAKYQPTIQLIIAQVERETRQIIQDAIDEHEAGPSPSTTRTLGTIAKAIGMRPDKGKYTADVTRVNELLEAERDADTGRDDITAVGKRTGQFTFKMTKEAKERQDREAEEADARKAAQAAQREEVDEEPEEEIEEE